MASKALKGLTIKIGGDTSELLDSLKDVEKKSRSLSGELGQINKLLKMDPTNTDLLAQKQKVLAEAISNTQNKLDALHEAEKQAQEQLANGDITEEQYRALQREIIETEKKLEGYKKAAKETADAADNLGNESEDAAEGVEDTGDAAKNAEDDVDSLGDKLKNVAKTGFKALATAATGAVTAIVATAEASREYRTEMGKLNTAFTDNGHSAEAATKTYKALQGVVGETDQAVEAANHLAALCDTEEELTDWTEILTGVYGKWGASLSIESLAEAANETARCGTVTGSFADSLNWATEEGETFGVKLKEATEENEEWNKAVEEATTAEDYFNLALQDCSDEQERQQLITKTLTELYGDAAEQYKETNEEVIRANEANEEWNAALAEIGEAVEPLVTDFKEFGVALLEWAAEPLKDIANWIRNKLIPALGKAASWVKKNKAPIIGFVSGLAAAFVAYKAATLLATAVTSAHTVALWAQTAAQTALNAAMSLSPVGLLTGAIAGLTVGIAAFTAAGGDAIEPLTSLTDQEYELIEASKEAADAFRDQKEATEDSINSINYDYSTVTDLKDELLTLVDAQGQVAEKDQARANYILNELEGITGKEIELVDGVVQGWDELKNSIDEVILSKQADALLEAANVDYVEAKEAEAAALEAASLAQQDYLAEKEAAEGVIAVLDQGIEAANERALTALRAGDSYMNQYWSTRSAELQEDKDAVLDNLATKEQAYLDAAADYKLYNDTVTAYTEAQQAALSGNYERTIDILSGEGAAYVQLSDEVDAETTRNVQILYKKAVDAGLAAENTKKNFEAGVEGYTAEMVTEAETAYSDALGAFGSAYADAQLVGEDLGGGLAGGMENKRSSLYIKARSLVTGIISAMRTEADSHSPARKTIDFGEDVGEGAEIGIENKTKDVTKAAQRQAEAVLGAYRSQEITAQRSLRNIAEQQTANRSTSQMTAANASAPMLQKILTAIEKGQVLLLDGDAVVGGTAGRMDSALGRRRALAAGGAI